MNIGDGVHPVDENNELHFPSNFCKMTTSLKELIATVFPNISQNYKNQEWLCERAILAPKNEDVSKLNHQILHDILGSSTKFKSIDTVTQTDQVVNYPIEFLNSLEPPGMPM